MIEKIKYMLELRRLGKLTKKYYKKYDAASDRAQQQGHDYGELSSIAQEIDEIENWINFYQTQYYSRICQKLILPMPDHENEEYYYKFNFDDDMGDRNILTLKGFSFVRNMIYEENKRRREHFGFWVTLSIGLIGALIGLISVFKK